MRPETGRYDRENGLSCFFLFDVFGIFEQLVSNKSHVLSMLEQAHRKANEIPLPVTEAVQMEGLAAVDHSRSSGTDSSCVMVLDGMGGLVSKWRLDSTVGEDSKVTHFSRAARADAGDDKCFYQLQVRLVSHSSVSENIP